jgi:hypothetical protein
MDAAPAINFSSSLAVDKNSLSNKDARTHLMLRMPGKSTSSLAETKRSKSRGPPKILPRSSRKTSSSNTPQIGGAEVMGSITGLPRQSSSRVASLSPFPVLNRTKARRRNPTRVTNRVKSHRSQPPHQPPTITLNL